MALTDCEQVDARIEDANNLLRDFEMFFRQSAGPTLRVAMDIGTDIPKCMIVSGINACETEEAG
jgi:hypothetical protein